MIYTDITLDIETLSLKPNALILSISAVAFNPFEITTDFSNNPTMDLLLDFDKQQHRDVNPSTVDWWSKQDEKVKNKIFSDTGRIPIPEAIGQLIKFCWLKDRIWCQGPTFDVTVLANIFDEYEKTLPWPYNAIRDSRTLLDLYNVQQPPVTHDSIEDCIRQTMGVQQALRGLSVTEFMRKR
jgi:hypothetical protein